MKKKILFATILLCLSLLLFACSERQEENSGDPTPEEKKGITLSFDTGFDNYTIPSVFLDGTTKTMPSAPFYAGYTFLGWYYDKEGTKPFYITDGFTADTTLYAKWRKNHSDIDDDNLGKQTETDATGLIYTEGENAYYVSGYTGYSPLVTLPETYKDLPVSGVKTGAFSGTMILRAELPASIKEVEDGAFSGASYLERIEVAAENAFYKDIDGVLYDKGGNSIVYLPCHNVEENYILPKEVICIRPYALHGCGCNLLFPADSLLTKVGENAFSGFSGVTVLPASLTTIEKYAFSGASCDVSFAPDCAISAFQNGEFDGFIGSKLVIPASVRTISGSPFFGCGAAVDLSQTGLTALGDSAFNGYIGQKLVIPPSVTTFGSGCFFRCTAEITFDERTDIRTIGELSFSNFGGTVYLPLSVRTIERYAFYHALPGSRIFFAVKKSQLVFEQGEESAFKDSKATVEYKE